MTSPIYADAVQARILKGIRRAYAGDQNVLAFFGAEGIREVSYEELEHPIRPPFLAIVSGQAKTERVVSRQADLLYSVPLVVFLPRQTPANPNVPTPTGLSVAAGVPGPLTGVYSYRATGWNAEGESWASAEVSVTLDHEAAVLTFGTIPSGIVGLRLWRTEAGRTASRYLETIQADALSAGTWTDSVLDRGLGDELAPIRLFGENLKDYLRLVLFGQETLRDENNVDLCDAALVFGDRVDTIDRSRNLRVIGMAAACSTIFSVETMQPTADEAP